MGYPEAEYAAQKVINALSGGSSPSGILSPLPSSVQLSIGNGIITATISGKRSIAVSESVISATDTVRVALNTNNVPLTYEDYTACIDFDLSNAEESYTLTKSVEFDSNAVYYKVFAVSSTGIVNDTTIASYPTQGTLYGDGYVADSRYQLSWYSLHRNNSSNSNMHDSDITDDDLKTVYYGFNEDFISNAKISNKNGVFQPFDKNHQSSNWLQASFFKKCKPFVIDSNGNAVQQLDPDDFTKTVTGEPSIVSDEDSWDRYQGVYVWVPRLYFQCGTYRHSDRYSNDGAYDLSSGIAQGLERPRSGHQNSTSTIVCSETDIPEENEKFAGSSKIPLLNHDLGKQEDMHIDFNASYKAANNVINTITPGFTDKNGKTYSGIWIPCYYASENGKSWPKAPEMITSAESVSTLIEKYKTSNNVLLMGGTIWETLNTILTLIGKSFDVAGTYGIGFKSSEVTGIAPVTQSCTPSKSGFTFSDSGWNKILNSYVLGSNSYFLMDPYVHSRKWTDSMSSSASRTMMCYQSTKMDTESFRDADGTAPTNSKYLVLYSPDHYDSHPDLNDTEMTLYFGNVLWADARGENDSDTALLVDNLPSMGQLGRVDFYISSDRNAFDSIDNAYMSYSHRSFRLPVEWQSSSNSNELPVYDNFALRRAPKRHDDLGLSEFMSLYVPNKTNMDTYFSENLVAYATMVLPPNETYMPVIQEES